MKTLQFNHNIEGSVSVMVEDEKVGIITDKNGKVSATVRYEGETYNMRYKSLEEARLDIRAFFVELDIYEF